MNKILLKLQKATFSFPPTPLLSLPTQIAATLMPGAMSTLIFTLSTFIHHLEKDLHMWGSSLIAANVPKQQATSYVVKLLVLTWQSNSAGTIWYDRVRAQKAWREFYLNLQANKVDSIAPLSSAIFLSVTGNMMSSLLTAMWHNSFTPHLNSWPNLLIEAQALTQYDTAEILPEAACIKVLVRVLKHDMSDNIQLKVRETAQDSTLDWNEMSWAQVTGAITVLSDDFQSTDCMMCHSPASIPNGPRRTGPTGNRPAPAPTPPSPTGNQPALLKKAAQSKPFCLYCLEHQFLFDKGSHSGQLRGWSHSTTRCYCLQDATPDLKAQWIQRHRTVA